MNYCERCGFEEPRHAWWCWDMMARSQHERWTELGPDNGCTPPF